METYLYIQIFFGMILLSFVVNSLFQGLQILLGKRKKLEIFKFYFSINNTKMGKDSFQKTREERLNPKFLVYFVGICVVFGSMFMIFLITPWMFALINTVISK